jgi:DNA-directed RNA polymerase subunit beta
VDKNTGREDALFDVYRVMRRAAADPEAAEAMFSLFFDGRR